MTACCSENPDDKNPKRVPIEQHHLGKKFVEDKLRQHYAEQGIYVSSSTGVFGLHPSEAVPETNEEVAAKRDVEKKYPEHFDRKDRYFLIQCTLVFHSFCYIYD